jgi:hypothetical protein
MQNTCGQSMGCARHQLSKIDDKALEKHASVYYTIQGSNTTARATDTGKRYNNRRCNSQQNVAWKDEYEKLLSSPDGYLGDAAVPASGVTTGWTPITSVGYRWIATVTLS